MRKLTARCAAGGLAAALAVLTERRKKK